MIIGVVGFLGSGKGTVSDILVQEHGFTKLSFADSLKDATSAIFGWPRALLEGDTGESREFREKVDDWWTKRLGYEVTPRNILQLIGTEAMRDNIHDDIWIRSLEKRIGMYNNVVIADVRFPNEIKFLRSIGGFVVRVKRGPEPEWFGDALLANSPDPFISSEFRHNMEIAKIHYSEWAWIGQSFDYDLHNESTKEMLASDIRHMKKVFSGPANKAA